MTNINIPGVIKACDSLAHRIITVEGKYHRSAFLFDQCMRAFDCERLPANAITFSVFLNAPVMREGTATIYRDGQLVIQTT